MILGKGGRINRRMTKLPVQWWNTLEERAQSPGFRLLALTLIVLAALIVRALVAWIHPFLLPDSFDYDTLARRIMLGKSYQVTGMLAKRMPGYPLFIAGVYAIFGISHLALLLVQAFCGALLSWVVYLIGRRISPAVGLVAAALTAADPLLICFAAALLSEIPFTLVFMISLLLLVEILESRHADGNLWRWALFGLCFLIGVYIRAEVSLCIFPLLAWVLFAGCRRNLPVADSASDTAGIKSNGPDQPARWSRIQNFFHSKRWGGLGVGASTALAIVFVGLLPWWIRNNRLFGHDFFRFTTLQGISLYESVYSGATGGPRQSHIPLPASMRKMNESQRDLAWTRRAFGDIFDHPLRIARLAVIKIARTWSPWLHARGYARPWINISLTIWYVPIFFLAMIGVFARGLPSRLLGVLLIPILYFTVMHALFLGSVRYRVPVTPLVMLLAAAGLKRLYGIRSADRPYDRFPTWPTIHEPVPPGGGKHVR